MPETLRARDFRLILICLLVCGASLWVGIRYFYRAFPEASIQFKVDRNSSEPLARQFLAARGLSTAGYRHASAFVYDDEAKVFLEREVGLARANAVMGADIRLWRWGHRWFRPREKEELRVEVTTRGEIASFAHLLAEDAPGADLPPDTARALAESFLFLDMGRPVDSLEFLEGRTQKRARRTDHVFTWKLIGADYSGAAYRVSVEIQGDRLGGYNEYLKVPEEWHRDYARLRSLNEGTSQVDLVLFVLLGAGMLVTLGRGIRLRDIRWQTALVFGAVCFTLQFLSSVNEFPVAEYGFNTADSYAGFVGFSILSAVLSAMGFGGAVALLTACTEPVYRRGFPEHTSIANILSWRALRTRGFLRASVVGVALTFFFFVYEIGFYLLANRLGAWAPAEVPYSNLLNTSFPWVFVLLGGFFPAVSEEWMFRAFSIPFLGGLLRRRWLAVGLSAFIWGFGHANYPNQPFYIRGIEVGLAGLVLGWAMIRFGILAPLIAHYSIDAFYSAFLLLRSGNAYLTAAGALTAGITLIPLLLAAGAWLATRRFLPDEDVSNASESRPAPEDLEPGPSGQAQVPAYSPLRKNAVSIACLALGAGLLSVFVRAPTFGSSLKYRLTAGQAVQAARRFLAEQNVDAGDFLAVAQPRARADPSAVQYTYTAAGIDGLKRIYEDLSIALVWRARFYRPLQKEEWSVDVDPSGGRIVAFEHSMPEDAPGADLTPEDARTVAGSFLASRRLDLTQFALQETRTERLERRRDTTLVWEALPGSPGSAGESRLRVVTAVRGAGVGAWTDYVKVPEDWKRARDRQNIYTITAISLRGVFLAVLFAAALLCLVRSTRNGTIRWGLAARIGLASMALEMLDMANAVPAFLFRYDTEVPRQVFLLSGFVEAVLLLMGIGLAAAVAAAVIMSCYPDAPAVLRPSGRAVWGRDAVYAAAAALGAFLLLQWGSTYVQYRGYRHALAPALAAPAMLGAYVPLITAFRDAWLTALFFSAVLAFGASVWTRLSGRVWLRGLLLAGLAGSFLPYGARRIAEAALETASSAALILFATLLVVVYLRNNYAAYPLAAAAISAARSSGALLGQGNPGLEFQGWLLWIVLAGGAIFFLFPGATWLPRLRRS